MDYKLFTLAQRSDKALELLGFPESVPNESSSSHFGWPVFVFQSYSGRIYWSRLAECFAEHQLFLLAQNEEIVASCYTIPFCWQGDKESLPEGWDKVLEKGCLDREHHHSPNALSLLAITVAPEYQGKGVSKFLLELIKAYVIENHLEYLVAPVRPVLKQFYPLAPIVEYAEWKTKDGKIFDPWLRVHISLGARIIKFAPRSMIVEGSISEWEQWTGMKFPASGEYIVPGALSPVTVYINEDKVIYHEPNIWLKHNLA
ncbi:MAG: GNAT family N-acetyltransferase [Rhizonema sp. PD38]|nr:GNAT family N-acetyltransferase [Rhizonema sp. PD38]